MENLHNNVFASTKLGGGILTEEEMENRDEATDVPSWFLWEKDPCIDFANALRLEQGAFLHGEEEMMMDLEDESEGRSEDDERDDDSMVDEVIVKGESSSRRLHCRHLLTLSYTARSSSPNLRFKPPTCAPTTHNPHPLQLPSTQWKSVGPPHPPTAQRHLHLGVQ